MLIPTHALIGFIRLFIPHLDTTTFILIIVLAFREMATQKIIILKQVNQMILKILFATKVAKESWLSYFSH